MSHKKVDLSATELLVERVNKNGLAHTAKQYDTHPSTLSRWLRSQGYKLVRQYVKGAAK